ncbi:trypsin-like peptidase domain-containing protein [Ruegeria pomeroyi]|nr:trypsin-like peptidase domain-containing protein [Ruegeria pomeroyi]
MSVPSHTPDAAVLEHLTGRNRGLYSWITSDRVELLLDRDGWLRVLAPGDVGIPGELIARVRRQEGVYHLITAPGARVWVNRQPVEAADLSHGDVIEFGEQGPLSRLRIYDERRRPHPTLAEMLGDALSYLRTSRRPLLARLPRAAGMFLARLLGNGALLFRGLVLLGLVGLAGLAIWQIRADRALRAQYESGRFQVEALASALAEARREAIRPGDLDALQDEIGLRLQLNAERLDTLEERSGAGTRVISTAAGSVAFIQGGYGLRHRDSGQMLRHVLDRAGNRLMLPNGQPMLSLDGTGPVAEVQYTGTGFVLAETGLIATNRHVAVPWEKSAAMGFGGDTMEPVFTRFIAYFPARPDPVDLEVRGLSDSADLALVAPVAPVDLPPGLPLAEVAPPPGLEVLVMGYPTGLMSMLVRSGTGFVEDLRSAGVTGFWEVAARLAGEGLIWPLASRGIVGQVTPALVTYDAETTHGGSGGPVLNLRGQVVAVNTAILPDFGGSNLGVPVARLRALLSAPAD